MESLLNLSKDELKAKLEEVRKEYAEFKAKKLSLNMARGKPSPKQTELSYEMLNILDEKTNFNIDGMDARNYGLFDGISKMKEFFAKLLGVQKQDVFVGGNSSLTLMFDTITCFYTHGVAGCLPWSKQGKIKFLCPVPGYDRHFGITGFYGFEIIPIKLNSDGPDMDEIENLVENDEQIKGIWCVPKYSNPAGITYSDEVVKRFAALKPKAKDFRIFWDNAYCVHDLTEHQEKLLNIMDECKKQGNEDLPILFTSTSKITFPGAGVAALAASENNMKEIKGRYKYQVISFDKLNQLRHALFFEKNDIYEHMQKHAKILAPKFEIVKNALKEELGPLNIASWSNPNGGYFISVDVYSGTAKKVVELCKQAGLTLTSAGATYPNGNDPDDKNIRIAPSFPEYDELKLAMKLFCICVKLAAIEKIMKNK